MGKSISSIENIIIVGGGTAGWLTAAYLSQELGTYRDDGVQITLIEASDIPTVGVGEGTFPSLRRTLEIIGVSEADFIRECDATFKQGIRFNNWQHNPDHGEHHYHHLFEAPRPLAGHLDIAPYWCLNDNPDKPNFASAVSLQASICDAAKGPKMPDDKNYRGSLNYAYHLDAGKLAEFLKKRSLFARVKHKVATIRHFHSDGDKNITQLELEDGETITADLYIDCTGFAASMIDAQLGSKLKTVSDTLFADRALTVRVSYENEMAPIPSSTLSSAHEGGWIWDIGLRHRRGIGFVYSSSHMSDNDAEQRFETYLNGAEPENDPRLIHMKTGYRETPWVGNCVAIGLSGGFLEPLEATGIALTEASIRLLADYFPRHGEMKQARKKFNRNMTRLYENAVVFIKMHYCLSQRTDSKFWHDNRDPSSIPEELKDLLDIWSYSYPKYSDFEEWQKTFGLESYQYVLFGMGFQPDLSHNRSAYPFEKQAMKEFETIRQAKMRAHQALPSHREIIERYHQS